MSLLKLSSQDFLRRKVHNTLFMPIRIEMVVIDLNNSLEIEFLFAGEWLRYLGIMSELCRNVVVFQ